jgi:glycosyltransferase involved in cell wall biosynthesis
MQTELDPASILNEFSPITIRKEDVCLNKTDLFVVIPAHNNAQVIGSTILSTRQHISNIIVVDDGSSDNTGDIAKSAGAEVIRLDYSTGREYSLLLGLRRAKERRCRAAVSIDAEGKYSPQDIDRVVGKIIRKEVDLVIGSRYLNRKIPLSSFEKYDQLSLMSGEVVTDSSSYFLAFGKRALENLDFPSDGAKLNRDLISFFDRQGLLIAEVPVSFNKSLSGDRCWDFPVNVLAGMPAFNEEKFIARTITGAQKLVNRVLVVDDGSSDATREIARDLGAIVIRHPENRGYGAAIRSIFEKARELNVDALVIIDSDGQHDPRDIEVLIERLRRGDVDVVIGSRFAQGKKQEVPRYRIFGMMVLDNFTRLAGADSNTDSQSGFRAYNKKAINLIRISGDGMSVGSEILIQAAYNNLKIAEVPIEVRYDIGETSSQHPVTHGVSVIYDLIGLISYRRPLPAFGIPGFLLVVIGLISGSAAFSEYYSTSKFPFVLSMVSAVFLIMGLLLIIGALILNYLVVFVKDQRQVPQN